MKSAIGLQGTTFNLVNGALSMGPMSLQSPEYGLNLI